MQHFSVRKFTGIIELTVDVGMFAFTHFFFFKKKHFLATKLFRINFAGPYIFLGLYTSFRPYHFDAYGPHTGPYFLWFSKEIARGAVRISSRATRFPALSLRRVRPPYGTSSLPSICGSHTLLSSHKSKGRKLSPFFQLRPRARLASSSSIYPLHFLYIRHSQTFPHRHHKGHNRARDTFVVQIHISTSSCCLYNICMSIIQYAEAFR